MNGLPPGVLVIAYAAAVLFPLAVLALLGIAEAGPGRGAAIDAGAIGFALLLLQFLSSGRFALLARRAGMDRVMRLHQLAARVGLILVLVHPFLFVAPGTLDALPAMAGQAAALFSAPPFMTGAIAWALLVALVAVAAVRERLPMRYEAWRASHMLMAIAIAIAGLHHALTTGTYSASPWLRMYWWALAVVAFGTIAYLYGVKPLLLRRRAYRVLANRPVGHGIREIVMEPACGRAIPFEAGQFAWVLLDQPPVTLLDHPFSFSSAPSELPRIRLLVKARGDFTRQLERVRVGAPAYIDGPHGNFTLEGRSGDAIALIAGGIGIAPVMSLLRHLRAMRDRRPIGLVYGARNASQLVHADEIRQSAGELDLQYHFFVDEPGPGWDGGVGELTREALGRALRRPPRDCLAFVCGPTPMMLACRAHLEACHVPRRQIVLERFDYD